MKTTVLIGLATAMLCAGLAIGNAHAVGGWPTPTQSCNQNNVGQTSDVYYYDRRTRQNLQITYYCNGSEWELFMVCDLNPGGICVVY